MIFDARTEKNLATLDPKAAEIFRPFIADAKVKAAQFGCEYIAIGGNRTWKEQDALYAKGRASPGPKVTNAKGGESNHNFAIALDFGVFKGGKYLDEHAPAIAAQVHKAVSLHILGRQIEWGGAWKFKDDPHFEIRTGLTLAQKRERYLKNKTVF